MCGRVFSGSDLRFDRLQKNELFPSRRRFCFPLQDSLVDPGTYSTRKHNFIPDLSDRNMFRSFMLHYIHQIFRNEHYECIPPKDRKNKKNAFGAIWLVTPDNVNKMSRLDR